MMSWSSYKVASMVATFFLISESSIIDVGQYSCGEYSNDLEYRISVMETESNIERFGELWDETGESMYLDSILDEFDRHPEIYVYNHF